ncbi:hypothetical protein VU05_05505 [Desulfobulbus sp. F1]|nr:hypothetical protein [Desulfobulbus sp. F1]
MNNPLTCDTVKKKPVTKGKPYSPEAAAKLEYFSVVYGKKLVVEAERVAKEEYVDQISCIHVEEAERRLRSIERRNWPKKLCGHASGVLLGVGLSTLVPILSNISQASPLILTIGVVSSLVGTAFLMFDALT